MMDKETALAQIKKDIFVGILNTGSNNQKERALDVSKEVYDWCVCHFRYEAPKTTESFVSVDVKPSRRGRPKKADS